MCEEVPLVPLGSVRLQVTRFYHADSLQHCQTPPSFIVPLQPGNLEYLDT